MLVIALLINCQVEQVSKRGLSSLLSSYTYALFFFLTTAGYQNIYERSSDIFFKFLISYFFSWNVVWGGVGVLIIIAAYASEW